MCKALVALFTAIAYFEFTFSEIPFSKSFNRLGTALVNHTVDISSSAVSGSNITINFAVNTAIDDVITIEYHTMVN